MPAWEATQLSPGLTIPVLLAGHVVGTRMANLLYGQLDPYSRVALALWQFRPDLGLRQSIVLLVAWTPGCIGIHFWLRLSPWYPRVRALLFATAILLPVLALLGFVNLGRTAAALIISEKVAARAGVDASAFPCHEITVRNRLEILAIRVIPDATDLDVRVLGGKMSYTTTHAYRARGGSQAWP
jgi:hypothetical protein